MKEIKANVNPRSYITLAGDSNISNIKVKTGRPVAIIESNNDSMAESDAAFDNEMDIFDLDSQTLEELAKIDKRSNNVEAETSQIPVPQLYGMNTVKQESDPEVNKKSTSKKNPSDEL